MSDLLLSVANSGLLDGWVGPILVHGQPAAILCLDDRDRRRAYGDRLAAPLAPNGWSDLSLDAAFMTRSIRSSEVFVDLARVECRELVTRKISTKAGRQTPALWSYYGGADGVCWRLLFSNSNYGVSFGAGPRPSWTAGNWYVISTLVGLESDKARLPDGSFRRDAQALLLVAQTVLDDSWVM